MNSHVQMPQTKNKPALLWQKRVQDPAERPFFPSGNKAAGNHPDLPDGSLSQKETPVRWTLLRAHYIPSNSLSSLYILTHSIVLTNLYDPYYYFSPPYGPGSPEKLCHFPQIHRVPESLLSFLQLFHIGIGCLDLELRNLGARNINVGVLHWLLTSCCHRRLSETVQNRDQMGGKKTKDGKHIIHSFVRSFQQLCPTRTKHCSRRCGNNCRPQRQDSYFHEAYFLIEEAGKKQMEQIGRKNRGSREKARRARLRALSSGDRKSAAKMESPSECSPGHAERLSSFQGHAPNSFSQIPIQSEK